jgi:hypothetical protein
MKHNKWFLVSVVVISLAMSFGVWTANAGSSGNKTTGGDFSLYQNFNFNFEIQYPKAWIMREKVMGTTAIFMSRLENQNDKFGENVNIIVRDISKQQYPSLHK